MNKKIKEEEFDFGNMGWAFAMINNKLAEFYFDKKKRGSISAHCYVKLEDYKTKREQKMIRDDITKYRFTKPPKASDSVWGCSGSPDDMIFATLSV
ncbi:MAG: hypothetical protein HZB10_00030 [Candidatus Yonathbacteria bacterium]|nr:hypothetical protein [Candidatus Yonathbacteria bacterium]